LKTSNKIPDFRFIYKSTEFDCNQYAKKHPGGLEFFEKFIDERKDMTEYFECLHSEQALKVLQSCPVVGKAVESKDSKMYTIILEKVKHLY
jgi:cytochrome b involved in lipid metabolism